MNSILQELSQICVGYQALPTDRQLAQAAISDSLGCMVAGRQEEPVLATFHALHRAGCDDGKARLITGGRSRPEIAAIINGTAAHALDFDDNFRPAMAHASAVIVPALIAIADDRQASGKALVDAYLIALLAQAFLGSCLNPSHYTAGWHGTSTIGTIGTAAGAAHLLGLDADGLCRAMSLGVSMACGLKGQFGSPVKPFHAGLAARNAVEAAYLAEAGLSGHADIVERDQGLIDMMHGRAISDRPKAGDFLAKGHPIATTGLMAKRFPCCASTHMALDMVLDLMDSHDLSADKIDRIDVKVRIANQRNLPFDRPLNAMQARFSMTYCLSKMLRNKDLGLSDFDDAEVLRFVDDPLLGKIHMHSYEAEEEAKQDFLPHRLCVSLTDGSRLVREKASPKGSGGEPLSREERRAKFIDCCHDIGQAEAIFDKLETLCDASDLSCLDDLFFATYGS